MVAIPVLAVPFLTLAFLLAQRRLGPHGAGLVGGLPSTLPIILVGTAIVAGDGAASRLALSTGAHIPIQVAFALVFAVVMGRAGIAAGLVVGIGVFVALSVVLAHAPLELGVLAAVPVLLAGRFLLPAGERTANGLDHSLQAVVVSCVVATVVVATVLAVVAAAGPVAGGALAAFPALSATLIVLLAMRDGTAAGAGALAGFVRDLLSFLVFCLLVALLADRVTTPWAVLSGVAAAAVVIWATWALDSQRDRPSVPGAT